MQPNEAKLDESKAPVRQAYQAPQLTRYGRVQDATGASGGRVKGGNATEHSGGARARP